MKNKIPETIEEYHRKWRKARHKLKAGSIHTMTDKEASVYKYYRNRKKQAKCFWDRFN